MEASSDELTAEDRLEIADLFSRWALYEDTERSDDWARLFTEDGVSNTGNGSQLVGHEALAANSRRRLLKPGAKTSFHWFDAPVITPHPEGAEARHYGVMIGNTGNGYEMGAMSVRTYRLRRENGRWKIAERGISKSFT